MLINKFDLDNLNHFLNDHHMRVLSEYLKLDQNHHPRHILFVMMVSDILAKDYLHYNKHDNVLLASLYHDIGRIYGDDDHAKQSVNVYKKSEHFNVSVVDAILNHNVKISDSNEVYIALHDADVLNIMRFNRIFDHTQLIISELRENYDRLLIEHNLLYNFSERLEKYYFGDQID